MDDAGGNRYLSAMVGYDRSRAIAAAKSILAQGGWCVLEFSTDVARQRWEARMLMFDLTPEAVADTVAEEFGDEPECDARLTGCNRGTLQPDPRMGAYPVLLGEESAVRDEGRCGSTRGSAAR